MTMQAIPGTQSALGESPFWHPEQQALYWVDIPGCAIRCLRPNGQIEHWPMPSEPGCIAPTPTTDLIVALRDGVYRFSPTSQALSLLATAPYDTTHFRFNDGKCDATGRFFAGSINEAKTGANAQLYCLEPGAPGSQPAWQLTSRAGGVTTANGLAFSADSRLAWWADTPAHRIDAFDYDSATGLLENRRTFKQFPHRSTTDKDSAYLGRPDGAAIDETGAYWCAMYEGGRVLRILSDGRIDREILVPAQCPTMVCFGGDDLQTLYVTTASAGRPKEELTALPNSGAVFTMHVDVAGLAVNCFSG